MGQKMVIFSDLSGEVINTDDALARIVIHEHPELGGGPVEIEVLADEALAVEKAALQIAVADLYLPGEDEPRRVAMEAAAFDKLATDKAMSELLITARPARRSAKSSTPSAARADRGSYASLENAGKPHKGKITDAEQQLVREHFDQINERLAAEGLRTISLTDPEHVERYGLAELAEQHSAAKPGAEQHSADKAGADKPRAEQRSADKPGAEHSADKPGADKPAAKSVPVPAASAV